MKLYALLSAQGTACAETVLREEDYTAENRARVEADALLDEAIDAPVPGTWTDVSDNRVCADAAEGAFD